MHIQGQISYSYTMTNKGLWNITFPRRRSRAVYIP